MTSRRFKASIENKDEAKIKPVTDEQIKEVLLELSNIQKSTRSENPLIDMTDLTTSHIAYVIENSIISDKNFHCELCKNVFNENEKVNNALMNSNHTKKSCQSTFYICKSADHIIKS